MIRALLLLCWLPVCALAAGTLEFEQPRLETTVPPGQKEITASFTFTVKGDGPVTILGTRTTCGCTVPDLERRAYQPGESGTITTKYRPGSRQGRHTVQIAVQTDSPAQPQVDLILEVTIPEVVSVRPRMIFWALGETPNPKSIEITLSTDEPVRITGAESANGDFTVRLVEVEAGRRYRIMVTPRATDGPYRAMIRWTYDSPWSGPAPTAYALIR